MRSARIEGGGSWRAFVKGLVCPAEAGAGCASAARQRQLMTRPVLVCVSGCQQHLLLARQLQLLLLRFARLSWLDKHINRWINVAMACGLAIRPSEAAVTFSQQHAKKCRQLVLLVTHYTSSLRRAPGRRPCRRAAA